MKIYLPLIARQRPPPDRHGPGVCCGPDRNWKSYPAPCVYGHNAYWLADAPSHFTCVYGIPSYKAKAELNWPADMPDLPAFVQKRRGRWWALGNEFNGRPSDWEPPISAREAADWSHVWATHLKKLDPTCKLATFGLACTYPEEQVAYFQQFVDYWRATYGRFVFDAVDIHVYTNPDRVRIFKRCLESLGLDGLEYWCSEFGVGPWDAPWDWIQKHMWDCVNAFERYDVTRYWWFVAHWDDFPTTCLWDRYGVWNRIGVEYDKICRALEGKYG